MNRPPDRSDLHRALAPARGALLLAMVGTVLAAVRWRWWPAMPAGIPIALLATALGLHAIGVVRRVRLYRRRG